MRSFWRSLMLSRKSVSLAVRAGFMSSARRSPNVKQTRSLLQVGTLLPRNKNLALERKHQRASLRRVDLHHKNPKFLSALLSCKPIYTIRQNMGLTIQLQNLIPSYLILHPSHRPKTLQNCPCLAIVAQHCDESLAKVHHSPLVCSQTQLSPAVAQHA